MFWLDVFLSFSGAVFIERRADHFRNIVHICVGSEGGTRSGTVVFTSCKHLDDCVSCDRCGLEWEIMVWGMGGG